MKVLFTSLIFISQLLVANEESFVDNGEYAAGESDNTTTFFSKNMPNNFLLYDVVQLPTNTLKIRLEGNKRRLKAVKNLLSTIEPQYEIGAISDLDIFSWNEVLFSIKYNILFDEYRIKEKNFNPYTSGNYLSEKLVLHFEELNYLDQQINRIKTMYDHGLITETIYDILNIKVVDAFTSYEITLSLYNEQRKEKKKSYKNLIHKMNSLFYKK